MHEPGNVYANFRQKVVLCNFMASLNEEFSALFIITSTLCLKEECLVESWASSVSPSRIL